MAKSTIASLIEENAKLKDSLDYWVREYASANARAELNAKNEKKLTDDLAVANNRVAHLQKDLESLEKARGELRQEVRVAEARADDLIDKLLDRVNVGV